MWEAFVNLVFQVLSAIQGVVGDWGLSVIILTVIIRLILTPLTNYSTRSMANMQAAQPRLQEIQARYADDPQRQMEEMRAAYSELKFNPLGGCLPLFLQMPVFFALFSAAGRVPADASFYNILPAIAARPAEIFSQMGFLPALPYILFVLAFAALTFFQLAINPSISPEQRKTNRAMGVVMSLMMLWFGWTVNAAVLIYYVTTSLWGLLQQRIITQRVLEKAKAEAAQKAEISTNIDVVRREKKVRPRKKSK